MPPRKPRRRPQPATSDLDNDSEAPLPPTSLPNTHYAPARTNEDLNLSVLKRHNPAVQQILSVAGFACVYRFSADSQTWVKIGVEGALFVCELLPGSQHSYPGQDRSVERYGVLVLNRKGLNNFHVELKSAGDVDVDEEYVILQVGEGEEVEEGIYGLWIFCPQGNTTDREVAAAVIMECAGRAERSMEVAGEGDAEYEAGYEDGFEDGRTEGLADGQELGQQETAAGGHEERHGGAQQTVSQGQQIDLLSLFGKAAAQQPQHTPMQQQQYYQHQPQPQQQQNGFHQDYQQPHQTSYPHGHPQAPVQATQAQNLLNLFKR
ncbi:Myosin-1 [Sphaceloma murrayae]|uniref:Myosin-1 n=1 Tax=Sphaceloma murrayae TaxID=2082308 RepID=A0A2K1QKJ9_9PEZI|nr:Myosin-1 [Sphaceloma murrayae]